MTATTLPFTWDRIDGGVRVLDNPGTGIHMAGLYETALIVEVERLRELTTPRTATTADELDTLAEGSVVLDFEGEAWRKRASGRWGSTHGDLHGAAWLAARGAVTVLHTP